MHPLLPLAVFLGRRYLLLAILQGKEFKLLQRYQDEDIKESFLCCQWIFCPELNTYLMSAGGNSGIVKAIDPQTGKLHSSFIGHGNAINQICMHPKRPHMFITASADNTARMWDVRTNKCVVIFGGYHGHREQVLSVDISVNECLVTGSIDGTIKVWNIPLPLNSEKLPLILQVPIFSSNEIFNSYVDHVQWHGDLILCKSTTNRIVLFKPEMIPISSDKNQSMPSKFVTEFETKNSNVWFVRFSVSDEGKLLSVGNIKGLVYIWNLESFRFIEPKKDNDIKVCRPYDPIILKNPKTDSIVRELVFTDNDKTIVALHDDGTLAIWRLSQ